MVDHHQGSMAHWRPRRRRGWRRGKMVALVVASSGRVVTMGCPIGISNGLICSGNGHCAENVTTGLDETCVCWEGYSGPDCSQRLCPSGRAWVDYARANNTAHALYVECSNMGYCDYETGLCACRAGFEGAACDRMRCPYSDTESGQKMCGGRGRCVSMAEAAREVDYEKLFYRGRYDEWDADMIYGCVCDEGYGGYDCSERQCPRGDDPLTAGVDEVQLIDCLCAGGCNGTLTLEFRGQVTDPIPHDATPELLETYLEKLSTVTDVEVSYRGGSRDFSLCDSFGTTAVVAFVGERGDVPTLNLSAALLNGASVAAVYADGAASVLRPSVVSVTGTKEDAECSNHGICDRDSGECVCYRGYVSSDGFGRPGTRGDCGAMEDNATINVRFYTGNATDSPCPIVTPEWAKATDPAVCSGVGNCLEDRTCNCTAGYEGNACEFKTCPVGESWFDEAQYAGDRAHRPGAVCSNRGVCNRGAGTCSCDSKFNLFAGDNCELLACFVNITKECSGNGRCATMAEFAQSAYQLGPAGVPLALNYSDPWDAHRMRSCLCEKMEGVWDWDTSSVTYRGPFAYAYSDYTGYSCSHAFCPTGDNPFTWGVNEVQGINCTARNGGFNLTFRGAQPPARVPWWADEEKIEAELEALASIRDVAVTFVHRNASANNTACGHGQYILIEFLSERGDLPSLVLDPTDLAGTVNVSEVQKGTKEDVECAAVGVCNRELGICSCLDGHYSGADVVPFREPGAVGQRGDCSFRHTSTDDPKWYNIKYLYSYEYVIIAEDGEEELAAE